MHKRKNTYFLHVLLDKRKRGDENGHRTGNTIRINDHLKVFGKEAKDMDYNGVDPGPFCGSRIDQFNFCACGGKLVVD